MEYYTLYLIIISVLSFSMAFAFIWSTRGIQYMTRDTDNEKQVLAAAQSRRWKWLSDMHTEGMVKTYMKDATIILIVLFQKILRDKETDHALVSACGFCNAVSSVMIYLIGTQLWNPHIGFVLGLLFLFSFWPWQIALFGSHVSMSHMYFLISAYFLLQAAVARESALVWIFLGGAVFGLTQYASATSRKYILLFFGTAIYARFASLLPLTLETFKNEAQKNFPMYLNIIIPMLLLAFFVVLKMGYKNLVTNIYNKKLPAILNRIIKSREKFSLEHYLLHAKKQAGLLIKKTTQISAFLLILVNLIGIAYLLNIFFGIAAVFLLFSLPDIPKNIKGYFYYYYFANKKGHFRIYREYFQALKKPIKSTARGDGNGIRWIFKYFWRITPIHSILFFTAVLFYIIPLFQSYDGKMALPFLFLFFLSISPVLWGELTESPQLGRTYSPGLIGMLLFIGFASAKISDPKIFFLLSLSAAFGVILHSAWIYFFDVFPARMQCSILLKHLRKLGIKEFSTHETEFNNALVNPIRDDIIKEFTVRRFQTLADAPSGWVVIPCTSSKAFNMESEMEGVRGGDFRRDLILNRLLETRLIESLAEVKIKTLGTSRIWVHESEVPSYRDLILGEVGEKDLFRGYAWIVHTDKLKEYIS